MKAPKLSPREREIADLLLFELGDKQIASELSLSVATVRFYLRNLRKKLKLHSRGGVALWFFKSEQRRLRTNSILGYSADSGRGAKVKAA